MTARRVGPYAPPSIEGGYVAGEAALSDGATAVIAHNDLLAIGVVLRLALAGRVRARRRQHRGLRQHLRFRLV